MIALSNDNLISAVRSLVKEERRVTKEILDHICEVEKRRLYADLGFSSIFEWLVKDLGYSESAAYRRMQAARLLRAVPEAGAKIESGELSLSVLSKVQTLIRADEKRTGERISLEKKSQILDEVESCSGREAEFRLASHFPEYCAAASREKIRVVSDDLVNVQVTFTRAQYEKLKRIQELLSHTQIEASNATLIDAAMDVFLEKRDPLKKIAKSRITQGNTAAEVKIEAVKLKPVTASMRNAVFRNSDGRCEYQDSKTGHRCESRHLLEIDHIQPRAIGGTNAVENLRALCRTHNLLMAERSFGREKISAFRQRT